MGQQPRPITQVEKSGNKLRSLWPRRDRADVQVDIQSELEFLLAQLTVINGDDRAADELSEYATTSSNIELRAVIGLSIQARIEDAEALFLSETSRRWSDAFNRIQTLPPFSTSGVRG